MPSIFPRKSLKTRCLLKNLTDAENTGACYPRVLMSGTGNESCTTIRFGLFELDTRSGELRKRGVKLKLSDQTYCILRALLNFPGEVVTRDQLIQAVWPDRTLVDFDSAINKSVSQIRRILGDSGESTIHRSTFRQGYRFIAPVAGGPASGTQRRGPSRCFHSENLTGDPALAYIARWPHRSANHWAQWAEPGTRDLRTSAKSCVAAGP